MLNWVEQTYIQKDENFGGIWPLIDIDITKNKTKISYKKHNLFKNMVLVKNGYVFLKTNGISSSLR